METGGLALHEWDDDVDGPGGPEPMVRTPGPPQKAETEDAAPLWVTLLGSSTFLI